MSINLAVGYPAIDALSALNHTHVAPLARRDFSVPGPFAGLPELRAAIVERQRKQHGLHWSADELIVTNGATEALHLLFRTLLRRDEEVLLPLPSWNFFRQNLDLDGIAYRTLTTRAETHFQPTARAIEAALTPRTRLLVLTNPGNPGGGVLRKTALEEIAAVVARHPELLVLADEVYELQAFGAPFVPFASLPGMAGRTITVHGFSKSYGLTAWRVGWLHAPAAHYDELLFRHQLLSYGVPPAGQYVAAAALRQEAAYRALWEAHIPGNQAYLADALAALPGISARVPPGAYFVLADIRESLQRRGQTSREWVEELAERQALQLRDASGEGAEGWLRINAAQERATLETAVDRLGHFLS